MGILSKRENLKGEKEWEEWNISLFSSSIFCISFSETVPIILWLESEPKAWSLSYNVDLFFPSWHFRLNLSLSLLAEFSSSTLRERERGKERVWEKRKNWQDRKPEIHFSSSPSLDPSTHNILKQLQPENNFLSVLIFLSFLQQFLLKWKCVQSAFPIQQIVPERRGRERERKESEGERKENRKNGGMKEQECVHCIVGGS